MATPEEIAAAGPARDALVRDVMAINQRAFSVSSGFTAAQINFLNEINARINRLRNDGDLWAAFMAGDVDYQHLGAYMKVQDDSLGILRKDLGMNYGSFGDFWRDVVAKTAGDIATDVKDAANELKTSAPYMVAIVVVVLVLILAIKVT